MKPGTKGEIVIQASKPKRNGQLWGDTIAYISLDVDEKTENLAQDILQTIKKHYPGAETKVKFKGESPFEFGPRVSEGEPSFWKKLTG